jgi:hypothetical protein
LRQGDQASGFAEINHALRADPKLVPLAVSRVWHLSQDPNVLLNQVLPADQDAYFQAIDFMQANGQPAAALGGFRPGFSKRRIGLALEFSVWRFDWL